MLKKDFDDLQGKGDFYFSRENTFITIRWGEDEFDIVSLPIVKGNHMVGKWGWNGDLEKPTLTPSIKISGTKDGSGIMELFHGWMRNGELE